MEQLERSLVLICAVGCAAAVGVVLYISIVPLWEGYKRSKLPVVTVHAVVQSREVFVDERIGYNLISTWRGPQNQRQVKTVFCTDNGERVVVHAAYHHYAELKEGTGGMLTHQGTKMEAFVPDEPEYRRP